MTNGKWPSFRGIYFIGLGRTYLPGGDGAKITESIKRMSHLDVELLLSRHGEIISGAQEVKSNFDQLEEFWFGYV